MRGANLCPTRCAELIRELERVYPYLAVQTQYSADSLLDSLERDGSLGESQWKFISGMVKTGRINMTKKRCPCCNGHGYLLPQKQAEA
jgi:hypothetical protein